ncbi:PEP/pyruvate-binding domain-containing protein [Paramicrobacterium fandaimingii]|uniref:PEP/pyruvate-binding domain-containing protein n=1 Tax=Paramicrobacterium fandaimingii TaxID=2708079 RepID=UPI001420B118|nr:PEP/pyruvate-binding domain-containing protein [Microbacterium fandaimingii]
MLQELRRADVTTSGAKAAALGTMLRAGLPVPDGFVLPFGTERSVTGGDLPDELHTELERAYTLLDHPVVAVRSSASGEDRAHMSAAGVHASILGVDGIEPLIAAIRDCWDSLNSDRALAYREAAGASATHSEMSVIVQSVVDADVSGVMFTGASSGEATLIESSWGLGPSIVDGRVIPDTYRNEPDGTIHHKLGSKGSRLDASGGSLTSRVVHEPQRSARSLDDEQVSTLVRLGAEIGVLLGGAQDIEWAVADEKIWILQARPVTAAVPSYAESPERRTATLTGAAASTGKACGAARIVRGPQDFSRVARGDILVCPSTDPSWTPLLGIAGGVVTERGGSLAHAATVARELGIPAVLGVTNATSRLTDGSIITIDGDLGTVVEHQPT